MKEGMGTKPIASDRGQYRATFPENSKRKIGWTRAKMTFSFLVMGVAFSSSHYESRGEAVDCRTTVLF